MLAYKERPRQGQDVVPSSDRESLPELLISLQQDDFLYEIVVSAYKNNLKTLSY